MRLGAAAGPQCYYTCRVTTVAIGQPFSTARVISFFPRVREPTQAGTCTLAEIGDKYSLYEASESSDAVLPEGLAFLHGQDQRLYRSLMHEAVACINPAADNITIRVEAVRRRESLDLPPDRVTPHVCPYLRAKHINGGLNIHILILS
jgi:hypothetical protein